MKFSSFLLSSSVLAATQIADGNDAQIEFHPYQVGIELSGKFYCGGTILSNKYIISAGHCTLLPDVTEPLTKLRVRAGTATRESGGQLVSVSNYQAHPEFKMGLADADSDVSVFELAQPLEFSDTVAPIDSLAFADAGFPREGIPCEVTGWGSKTPNGPFSTTLQVVELPVADREECVRKYDELGTGQEVGERMFCAGDFEEESPICQGDSGGALVSGGQMLGIVSWGKGCRAKGYPAVFTSISKVRDFIADVTGI